MPSPANAIVHRDCGNPCRHDEPHGEFSIGRMAADQVEDAVFSTTCSENNHLAMSDTSVSLVEELLILLLCLQKQHRNETTQATNQQRSKPSHHNRPPLQLSKSAAELNIEPRHDVSWEPDGLASSRPRRPMNMQPKQRLPPSHLRKQTAIPTADRPQVVASLLHKPSKRP